MLTNAIKELLHDRIRDTAVSCVIGVAVFAIIAYLGVRSFADTIAIAVGVLLGGGLASHKPPLLPLSHHDSESEIQLNLFLSSQNRNDAWYFVVFFELILCITGIYWVLAGQWWTNTTLISGIIGCIISADLIQRL